MKSILPLLLVIAALLSGCQNLPEKLRQFDELGIKKAEITGKFSHTEYERVDKDGVTTSTLEHNNPWITKAVVVRERPTPPVK